MSRTALVLLHAESLAEHGGREGMRDEALLDSALARPRNLLAYENITEVPRLAAAYATGIARNHPFVDGNKRAALISAGLFMALNGLRLNADKVDAVRTMLVLADGSLTEAALAAWLAQNSVAF